MKITKKKLQNIIKEELNTILTEEGLDWWHDWKELARQRGEDPTDIYKHPAYIQAEGQRQELEGKLKLLMNKLQEIIDEIR